MKPFNLERALAGDPVVTRSGKKVIALYPIKEFSDVDNRMDLFVIIEGKNNNPDWGWSHQNGCQQKDGQGEYDFDLLMVPKEKTYWFNIFRNKTDHNVIDFSCSYLSAADAIKAINHESIYWNYIKTISLTIEE